MMTADYPASAERPEPPAELDFGLLKAGDQVMLYFSDGRAYRLAIDELDPKDGIFARLEVGSKSQLSSEIERWEENPRRVKVKGSCQRLRVEQGEVVVEGARPGNFTVSQSAWLGFNTDQGEKIFISSVIARIEHIPVADEHQ